MFVVVTLNQLFGYSQNHYDIIVYKKRPTCFNHLQARCLPVLSFSKDRVPPLPRCFFYSNKKQLSGCIYVDSRVLIHTTEYPVLCLLPGCRYHTIIPIPIPWLSLSLTLPKSKEIEYTSSFFLLRT